MAARRGQWKHTPVPQPQSIPPPSKRWTQAEWTQIKQGFVPAAMEDKWFAFVEDDRLYLHRSWTGFGVYEAQFASEDRGWAIAEALVAGDHDTYRRGSDAYESLQLELLIDAGLLRRDRHDDFKRLQSSEDR
jgi:hypothetical protein